MRGGDEGLNTREQGVSRVFSTAAMKPYEAQRTHARPTLQACHAGGGSVPTVYYCD